MKLAVLVCVLVAAVFAQRDPFAGVFQGDKITLELKGAGGSYSGTLTVQGMSFPASAATVGTSANGAFAAGGRNYPFTLTPYGNGFKLVSEGVEYLLVRKVEAANAPAPLQPRIAPPAPGPARAMDDIPAPAGAVPAEAPAKSTAGGSIVGNWRNATGSAQFNADGTGMVDGQPGRYVIRGDQLTLIGAQGQLTVQFALMGDQLTITANGIPIVLQRVKEEAGAGSVPNPAPAPAAAAEPPAPAGALTPAAPAQPAAGGIVGTWRNAQGSAQFHADGTGMVDGQAGRYVIRGDQLTLIGAQGQLTVQFALMGDQLTITANGNTIVLQRAKEETGPGSVHMELVGKWCWMSQVYANNGGARQSNRCITLNGNGSYQYAGMTDSYNPYGGATSQSSDQGTWTATETTLTARSVTGKVTVYRLEKRNHPKNVRDPMIVLNGETFVTAYNKPPW